MCVGGGESAVLFKVSLGNKMMQELASVLAVAAHVSAQVTPRTWGAEAG